MTTVKMFQVPENVFNALAQYLATKPFNEVNQLLTAVGQTVRVVEVHVEQPTTNIAQKGAPEKSSDNQEGA